MHKQMTLLSFLNILQVFQTIFVLVNASKCVSTGECGCQLEDGRSIDLSPMIAAAGKSPMFKNSNGINQNYIYNIDLCRGFKCATEEDSRVCLTAKSIVTVTLSIGRSLSYEYDTSSDVVTFVYSDKTSIGDDVSTRITMHCSTTASGLGTLSTIEDTQQSQLFRTTLTSKYACFNDQHGKSRNKLSLGSILCIGYAAYKVLYNLSYPVSPMAYRTFYLFGSFRLLVLVVIYIVGGIIINKFVRKPEDGTLMPNKEFWKSLPGYIKDGFTFTWGKIRRKNGEYEQI